MTQLPGSRADTPSAARAPSPRGTVRRRWTISFVLYLVPEGGLGDLYAYTQYDKDF